MKTLLVVLVCFSLSALAQSPTPAPSASPKPHQRSAEKLLAKPKSQKLVAQKKQSATPKPMGSSNVWANSLCARISADMIKRHKPALKCPQK